MRFQALGDEVHPRSPSVPTERPVQGWRSSSASWPMHGHHARLLISTSSKYRQPARRGGGGHRKEQRASYARKSERPASTRTRKFSLGARSSASRAAVRRAGGAEAKMSGSIELGRREKSSRRRGTGQVPGTRWHSPSGRAKGKKKRRILKRNR
jgi:hypothetical protein